MVTGSVPDLILTYCMVGWYAAHRQFYVFSCIWYRLCFQYVTHSKYVETYLTQMIGDMSALQSIHVWIYIQRTKFKCQNVDRSDNRELSSTIISFFFFVHRLHSSVEFVFYFLSISFRARLYFCFFNKILTNVSPKNNFCF